MEKSEFFRFAKAFTSVVFLILILDFLIGSGLKMLHKNQVSGLLYLTSYSIDSTSQDILVFGSSRANHHYEPDIFEDSLTLSFYNCGRDGAGLIYSAAVINSVVNRYKPNLILLDIRPSELSSSEDGQLSALLPHYENSGIKPFIKHHGKYESLKMHSWIYPYNSLVTNLLIGLTDVHRNGISENKGYIKLDGSLVNTVKEKEFEKFELEESKIAVLDDLLMTLDGMGIQTYVIISPLYADLNDNKTIEKSKLITAKYKKCKFLDYSSGPLTMNPKHFRDSYHMNHVGARIFSSEIVRIIKSDIEAAKK